MRSKTRFSGFCDVFIYRGFRQESMDQTEAGDPGRGHVEKFKSYHYSNDRRPLQLECGVQAERREPGIAKYSGA